MTARARVLQMIAADTGVLNGHEAPSTVTWDWLYEVLPTVSRLRRTVLCHACHPAATGNDSSVGTVKMPPDPDTDPRLGSPMLQSPYSPAGQCMVRVETVPSHESVAVGGSDRGRGAASTGTAIVSSTPAIAAPRNQRRRGDSRGVIGQMWHPIPEWTIQIEGLPPKRARGGGR